MGRIKPCGSQYFMQMYLTPESHPKQQKVFGPVRHGMIDNRNAKFTWLNYIYIYIDTHLVKPSLHPFVYAKCHLTPLKSPSQSPICSNQSHQIPSKFPRSSQSPKSPSQSSIFVEIPRLGVNHLGHFALCGHLLPLLGRSGRAARVVSVSSLAHRLGSGARLLQEPWISGSLPGS